jgi:GT2 family glycosyltransferase
MKDLHIVLINYFCKEDIFNAADSLLKDAAISKYDVQITVVDNSLNQDGIKSELEIKFPTVLYVNGEKNLGFGKGNVKGFKSVSARYYFALNRDISIPANTNVLGRLIDFMDRNPQIGCIGPKLVNSDGTIQHSCFRFDLNSILIKPFKQINWDKKYTWVKKHADQLLMSDFDHEETRPVDWVLGAAMLVRDKVVQEVGWFDERYFMYLEDCDWCKTMWEKGWPVYYVHDVVIKHGYARDSAKIPGIVRALFLNKLARIHIVSWFKYMWKWRSSHKYYGKVS